MKHKKYLSISCSVVLCIILIISLATASAQNSNLSVLRNAGLVARAKLDGAQPSDSNTNVPTSIVADSFCIPEDYYLNTVEELLVTGHSNSEAEELARQILIEKFALYNTAVSVGAIASDDDVSTVIDATKNGIENASNKADFYAYIDGMGLTSDEYWESQFENVKMYESIALYKEDYLEKYLADQQKTDITNAQQFADLDSVWNNHVSDILAAENIVYTK